MKMIGPITPDKWEREVRRQLESQLPQDWIVVCNVSWAYRNAAGYVRDGQSDFVVLVPEHGLIILEVKGSQSVRVSADGIWYVRKEDRKSATEGFEFALKESPPEQANRNMHTLVAILNKDLGVPEFPGTYAFVVAYPNGAVHGKLDLYDPTTLITSRQMSQLVRCLRAALEGRGSAGKGREFTAALAMKVATTLSNQRFAIEKVDSPLDNENDIKDVDQLTRQQFAVLRGAFELPSVAIVGPAGSGKTMLALWKLAALLEEGKRAIYVCFNKALAIYLRTQEPSLAQAIMSVDSFFTQFIQQRNGISLTSEYFQETLPQEVLDIAAEMPTQKKYDAVVVDEGQDFGDYRVMALLELLKKGGQWLYFADQGQDVYRVGNTAMFGAEVTFRLHHNCRNTESTNKATNILCKQSVEPMPGVPFGEHPVLVKCQSAELMAARAWEIVHDLTPEGGAVMLSPYKLENSCVAGKTRAYGLQLTEDIQLLGKAGYIFFSTIKSFKGLEGGQVVVLHAEIPNTVQAFSTEDLYVACTRATGRLAILTLSDDAFKWFTQIGVSTGKRKP